MSVRCMTAVFDRYPVGGGEFVLALALADHADETGEHIFPSVGRLAVKSRQTERGVQKQLQRMLECKWLLLVAAACGHRPNEYRINPSWLDGDNLEELSATPDDSASKTPEVSALPPNRVHPYPRTAFTPTPEPRSPLPPNRVHPLLDLDLRVKSKRGEARAREIATLQCVPENFQPDETTAYRLHTSGCPPSTEDQVQGFIAYYQSVGKLASDWQARFVQWCIREKGYAKHENSSRASRRRSAGEIHAAACAPRPGEEAEAARIDAILGS